jgi:predicted SnoaL-like aldol condensation-catalyzing enzyme
MVVADSITDNTSMAASIIEGKSVPVVGAADPLSLLRDDDPTLATNKRLVFDLWRGVVNAGHVELADKFLTEGYIQHSPVLPTGRKAFKKIFSAVPRLDKIPELVQPPLVNIIAEGDRVVMTLAESVQEPDGSDKYTTTHFNMLRIENGRLAEHWHSVQTPPGPGVLPPEEGGPQPVKGITGRAQLALLHASDPKLAANKRLVFDMWRNIIDAGQEKATDLYLDKGYIEHDPTSATGRDAFEVRVAKQKGRPLEATPGFHRLDRRGGRPRSGGDPAGAPPSDPPGQDIHDDLVRHVSDRRRTDRRTLEPGPQDGAGCELKARASVPIASGKPDRGFAALTRMAQFAPSAA